MLEEKLRQASQAEAKNSRRLFAAIGLTVLISVASLLMLNYVNDHTPVAKAHVSASVQSPSTPSSTPLKRTPAESSQLRAQFMLTLRRYESEIAPALRDANLQLWNTEKAAAINTLNENATAAFTRADYPSAIQALNQREDMAKQVLAQRETRFNKEFSMAHSAMQADQYSQAKLHIEKALQLKANDPATLQLAEQINVLPKVLSWLNKAAIAHTENKLAQEYAAVQAAFAIAPQRPQLKQRQAELAKRIKDNHFSPFIAHGLERVDNNDLRAARSDFQQAKALYPQRSELHILKQAIDKLANRQDLNRSIKQGQSAIHHDDWRKAQAVYTAATQRHPDNKSIRDGLQLSSKLVRLHETLDAYLQSPERLASPHIAASAQQARIQANMFASNSPVLRQKTLALKSLLSALDIPIAVTITSDKQTYILLKGIGKIGLTQAHTIQLKAGNYTFEGLRKGYKSKLVHLHIPIGATSFTIEVICDERI